MPITPTTTTRCTAASPQSWRAASGSSCACTAATPDAAEHRAGNLGYTVFASAMDKPHGLRETYLLDKDGYLWVPDVPRG